MYMYDTPTHDPLSDLRHRVELNSVWQSISDIVMHFDQQEVAKQMDQMAPNRRGNERADDGQGGGRGGR